MAAESRRLFGFILGRDNPISLILAGTGRRQRDIIEGNGHTGRGAVVQILTRQPGVKAVR